MNSKHLLRVEQLFLQSRYTEARTHLETHLSAYPTDFFGRKLYIITLLQCEEKDKARQLCEQLLAEYPEEEDVIMLSAEIDMMDDYYDKALSKVALLKQMSAMDADVFLLEAKIKFSQNNYDKALAAVHQALHLEADNVDALNLKVMLDNILGNSTAGINIEQALHLAPEDASTIANHALHLLKQQKVAAALERASEALQKDPQNGLARYAMQEALKSRFGIYRLFGKYQDFTTKLTANGSWAFIIGSYILYRIILHFSETYPALFPLVYFILALFLLTWLITPLSNLYLKFNKYGKLLLDKDDKTMAVQVGITLSIALSSLLVGWFTDSNTFFTLGAIAAFLSIPFSTYLNPTAEKTRSKLKSFTIALVVLGIFSALTNLGLFFLLFVVGIFAYQIYYSSLVIKESARVID